MSSIYCSLTDPTVVYHSVSIKFVRQEERNLIVAKRNLLQVFRLIRLEEDLTSAAVDADQETETAANEDDFIGASLAIRKSARRTVSKLLLIAEYRLFGNITSLGAIRTQNYDETGLEYLLVSCEVAKVSLLRWDSDLDSVVTVSLHAFDRDEYRSPLVAPEKGFMRIDPLSRVATLSFFGDHLAFMPISQKDELMIDEQEDDSEEHGPISNSFVLPVRQLEDDITQLLDFAFVEGYREPALALLYSAQGTATGLLKHWRKDTSKLVILTLDIQAGARTAIFAIDDLPSDLKHVCPIPHPVGGCLLVGTNEIIYVDSASRVVALAVNSYAKQSSGLPMRDYSNLNLSLERCYAVPLQDGDILDGVLLILSTGQLCLLTLNLDGRTVSSLHLKIVTQEFGGDILSSGAHCATLLGNKFLFLGCTTGDSKLLAWKRKARPAPTTSMTDGVKQDEVLDVKEGEEQDNETDDLDELYGDEATEKKLFGAEKTEFDLHFSTHDTIDNCGPITGMALGIPYAAEDDDRQLDVGAALEIVTTSGSDSAGRMTIFRRSITSEVIGKFDSPEWEALWTVKVKNVTTEEDDNVSNVLDTYLMASKAMDTQVFTIDTAFIEKTDSEFETSDPTIFVGTIMAQTCIVQICPDMMRTYDADLRLLEMKPTPEGCTIVSASIVDPYVLLVLDTAKLALYSATMKIKELVEMDAVMNQDNDTLCATLYDPTVSGSVLIAILKPNRGKSSKKRKRDGLEQEMGEDDCLCFTVTAEGHLKVYALPSRELIFFSSKVSLLPEYITNEQQQTSNGQQGAHAEKSLSRLAIVEISVGDLGQHSRSTLLVLRTSAHGIIVYRPYLDSAGGLRFHKHRESLQQLTRSPESQEEASEEQKTKAQKPQMTLCQDVAGFSCIFISNGAYSSWLLQTDQSLPIFQSAGLSGVRSLSGFNTVDAQNGFIYCDSSSVIRICRLPVEFSFTSSWSKRTVAIGRSVHSIAYYADQQVYAIITSQEEHFEIPDEEDEEWQPTTENREKLPLLARSAIELVDGRTFSVIDRYELGDNEQGMCLRSVNLTIATDYTKKKRPCLAVSTGILRGEDLAMKGAIYLFDVVEVVPEVGHPDHKYRLKSVCREEVKAAVTTLCEVDGYLLSAQGQKVVVRSLEEDERLTPVAFVDLGLATTTAKCLRSMILFGDVQKGLRFVGFGEEPYKMTSFGRDFEAMDVMDAEFMVDGRNLYFAAADFDGNIRILQYDPENSTTLAGTRLIRRADIHAGHVISTMMLLPMATEETEAYIEKSMVICASQDGSLSVVMPVSERSYRRLYTIQAQLTSTEVQTAGLNPRAYRLCTTEGLTSNAARGILDGPLLQNFAHLDRLTQTQLAQKSGVGAENVLQDLGQLLQGLSCL